MNTLSSKMNNLIDLTLVHIPLLINKLHQVVYFLIRLDESQNIYIKVYKILNYSNS